jgi:hypothetical protein
MKASDLVSLWNAPDNSRLTAKQYSFRLPVQVAAKLSALCELYPNKTRTEIVADLLRTAIADVEKALPSHAGRFVDKHPDTGEAMYLEEGVKAQFRELANKYNKELEAELGNELPRNLYEGDFCTYADKE